MLAWLNCEAPHLVDRGCDDWYRAVLRHDVAKVIAAADVVGDYLSDVDPVPKFFRAHCDALSLGYLVGIGGDMKRSFVV